MGKERLRDTVEARKNYVRKLVMQGWLEEDIVRRCLKSDLFVLSRYAEGHANRRIRPRTIRERYLYVVRKELRKQHFDTDEEIAKACHDFALALAYAHEQKNAQAVARVWREKGRMLGLRRPPDAGHGCDGATVAGQVKAMDISIGSPGEDAE